VSSLVNISPGKLALFLAAALTVSLQRNRSVEDLEAALPAHILLYPLGQGGLELDHFAAAQAD